MKTHINTRLPVWLEPDFSPHSEIMCLPTVVTHPFNFLQQTGLETHNTKPPFLCLAHMHALLHLLQIRMHTPPTPNVHTVLHYSQSKHMRVWHPRSTRFCSFHGGVKLLWFVLPHKISILPKKPIANHGWSENNIILMGLITYRFTHSTALNNTFQNQKVRQLWN